VARDTGTHGLGVPHDGTVEQTEVLDVHDWWVDENEHEFESLAPAEVQG
jgi:hypothetical protein